MCGIAGFVGVGGLEAVELERQVLGALEHRGPDDVGSILGDDYWIGMRRLAIIDLETGKQPLGNEDGSIQVVLNGEIYNYRELRDELRARGHVLRTSSDTEVLPHLFEDLGRELCQRLRGMFAFAIWDSKDRRLLLGRDRFGKKPLYIARTREGGLLFSSEIKALRPLMQAAGVPIEISPQAIYDYLSLGVVPQPSTVYEGIRLLPPGHTLEWRDGNVSLTRYWRPEVEPKAALNTNQLHERLQAKIGEAVQIRLRSDVPLGVFLSGGVDSTVVAIEAARRLGGSLRTFTIGVEDSDLDESGVAARTAGKLGVDHEVLRLEVAPIDEVLRIATHFDQPFADPSAIPSLAVARLARQHVTVVLNGDGGDEVFGGYRRYWAAEITRRLPGARLLAALAGHVLPRSGPDGRRSTFGFAQRLARGLREHGGARYLTWTTDFLRENDKKLGWRGVPCRPTEDWLQEVIPHPLTGVDGFVLADMTVNLLSDLLVKMDMATMASSLEARSPLLDHEVSEIALTTPPEARVTARSLKAALRGAYRSELPEEVLRGGKRGFEVPLLRWVRGDLQALIRDTVTSPEARLGRFLDPGFVRLVVDGALLTERNWPGFVYALLMLELWMREEH